MAEKKVAEEICPCGGHRAELWVDEGTKEWRLDFVSVEEAKKSKTSEPAEKESTIIGRILLGE